MSQENVEIVRRAVQAFNERDFPAIESGYAEDVVLRHIGGMDALIGTEFRGRDAVVNSMREVIATVGGRGEIEMIREVSDRVVVIVNAALMGTKSGVPVTMRFGQVYSFREGNISLIDSYYSADDALQAVGLEE
jgi:ketosteroid isomerase-like protein